MGRMTFVLRRLALLVPTAVGVTIIMFFMIHLIPGDPAVTILGQRANPRPSPLLHQQWGLNQPLTSSTGCSSTGCSTATWARACTTECRSRA